MSMHGKRSVMMNESYQVVRRTYLNDNGLEYYEEKLSPDEATSHAIDLLNAAQMAKYYQETSRNPRG